MENLIWVVTTDSAYRMGVLCFLGEGATKDDALEDAYGPKEQWGNSAKKSISRAQVYQITASELAELKYAAA